MEVYSQLLRKNWPVNSYHRRFSEDGKNLIGKLKSGHYIIYQTDILIHIKKLSKCFKKFKF